MLNQYLTVSNEISIHYRDNGASGQPPLLLLHSLSDNTHAFDAVIAAGLDARFRIISPDMRGRGASSRPHSGYSLDEHCKDLLTLLDSQGIDKTFVAGHSFGALLGLYFAAHHPDRVLGLTMIDAATELHPLTPLFVLLLADRLGKWYPDAESYILKMRAAPFMTTWDPAMRQMFLADTLMLTDDSVYVQTQKAHIAQCALAVQSVSKEEWRSFALRVPGPSQVLYAAEPFIQGQHIVSAKKALETAVLMPGGETAQISGNHLSMLFGQGAKEIAAKIIARFIPAATHRKRVAAAL